MKRFLIISLLILIFLAGCGQERIVNTVSYDQMQESDNALLIIPSTPEEFCYSDRMNRVFQDYAKENNYGESNSLSVNSAIDCGYFGFSNCEVQVDESDSTEYQLCTSDDGMRECLYMLESGYQDATGKGFDETCVIGFNTST